MFSLERASHEATSTKNHTQVLKEQISYERGAFIYKNLTKENPKECLFEFYF